MPRGGKRRRHTPPAFNADEVRELRRQREAGTQYKVLMRLTGHSRDVLRRAIYGLEHYEGIK